MLPNDDEQVRPHLHLGQSLSNQPDLSKKGSARRKAMNRPTVSFDCFVDEQKSSMEQERLIKLRDSMKSMNSLSSEQSMSATRKASLFVRRVSMAIPSLSGDPVPPTVRKGYLLVDSLLVGRAIIGLFYFKLFGPFLLFLLQNYFSQIFSLNTTVTFLYLLIIRYLSGCTITTLRLLSFSFIIYLFKFIFICFVSLSFYLCHHFYFLCFLVKTTSKKWKNLFSGHKMRCNGSHLP